MKILATHRNLDNNTIRTQQKQGPVDFFTLSNPLDSQPSWKPVRLGLRRFEKECDRLEQENFKALTEPPPSHGERVLPKDNSVNPDAMVMAYNPDDPSSLPFISQMAQVGTVEGFRVLARCAPEQSKEFRAQVKKQAGHDNITVVPSQGLQDVWTEDQGEFTIQGGLILPPRLSTSSPLGVHQVRDRLERLYPDSDLEQLEAGLTSYNLEQAMGQYPRANFAYQGLVCQSETNLGMLGSALALRIPKYRMAITYIEGGNFLPGADQTGEPLALIGKDSVAITQRVLEQDLGCKPTQDQVMQKIADDYGLKSSKVFAVEQPADFHLDMAMTWTRPGQLLLNDSMDAFQRQNCWLERQEKEELQSAPDQAQDIRQKYQQERDRLQQEAVHRADLESLTARDLQATGVQVFRFGGAFPESLANPPMNFFNLRQGTNEEGKTFAVLLGGTPEAEEFIGQKLLHEIPTGYQRIHFLDRELTKPTLDLWGGVKCRTKPMVCAS